MSEYLIQKTTLDGIADAIREKTGSADELTAAEMKEAIKAIVTKEDIPNAEEAKF